MARKNPMAVTCPECDGNNVRMSKHTSFLERMLDLFGMPTMRCTDCDHRWKHSLWRVREVAYARCPRCYQLYLAQWEETYYHIPKWWRFQISLGAKKVRCKPCRHNFVSFRLVKGTPKWKNEADPAEEVVESTITLKSIEDVDAPDVHKT